MNNLGNLQTTKSLLNPAPNVAKRQGLVGVHQNNIQI